MRLTWLRLVGLISSFAVGLVVIGAGALLVGATSVDWREGLAALLGRQDRRTSVSYMILVEQRLPRIFLASLTGAALGMAGTTLQAILRNPLADPYTLGIASGSAVGAVVAISFKLQFHLGPFNSVALLSLAGASLMLGLIYWLGRGPEHLSTDGLLLAGVTMAFIAGSAIMFIRYLSEPHRLVAMDRWLMGGLAVVGFGDVLAILPLLLPGAVILFALTPGMNQIAMGEDMAFGRGVPIAAFQKWGFAGASLVTAAVVAVAGPIGFVGLIVPHAIRRLIGPDHRLLLPCAALASGGFLILCDTVARTILAPTELPVGVVTALCGGPFFLWLLLQRSRRKT
ncbi:MAG: iron ABC transporter permease [Armatimonadetes bacterium]|nr:iron ABC transporter permease [Armatimonadota bacterium]